MNRRNSWLILILALLLPATVSTAAKPSEQLLPKNTRAFISVADPGRFEAAWKKTEWGQLANDPLMKEFADELHRYYQQQYTAKFEAGTGTTLDELRKVASGELAGAIVETAPKTAATVVIADVSGNESQARSLIAQISARLKQRGAKEESLQVDSTTIQTWKWKTDSNEKRQAAIVLKDGTLALSTDIDSIRGILSRWNTRGESLGATVAFQKAMSDCRPNAAGKPELRWLIDPVGMLRLTHQPGPFDEPRDHPAEFAKRHGLDAVRRIAGTVTLTDPSYDVLLRIAVYAPKPYRKTMAMFSFPAGTDFEPPSWIPDDVNMVTCLNFDLTAAFDNIGGLFDDLYADGIEGTFDDILADLKADDGPRVDVRKEVIDHIGPRITMLNDSLRPVAGRNERSLIAVNVKDSKIVAQAVKKMLRDDPGVKRYRVEPYKNDLWTIGESSGRDGQAGAPRYRTLAVMVARDQLLIATNADLIRKLLAGKPEKQFSTAKDFRTVMNRADKLAASNVIGRIFSRTDRDFETTYKLIRTGRMNEAESIYGMVAGTFLSAFEDKETGKSNIDFQKLPKFDGIRKYFGLLGIVGENTEHGWRITGFTLPSGD